MESELAIGKWVRIQSYKHDGSLHRTWDNMMVIDINDDYVITGSSSSRVVECDGRIWYTKEPAVSIFSLKRWFNVIAMIRGKNICYYCNIASPSLIEHHLIEYIDYDLDLKLFPTGDIMELDRKEYLFHKDKYQYPDSIDLIVNREFQRVKAMMEKNEFPFDDKKIHEYIDEFYKIKREQDEIY